MAIAPSYMRRKPLSSMLDFAEERAREAASLGDVITKLAQPTLTSMGAAPEPAVQRGPAPAPQKLGTMTGPATVTRAGSTIDPATITDPLFRSMVKQESGFRTDAVSPKGATGVAQIMPSTAVDPGFGVPSIFDLADASGIDYSSRTQDEAKRLLLQQPDLNLQFGQLYKNAMSDRYGGDPKLTAAAYNAGAGAVDKYGGVPPFAETQGYVAAVVPGANGLTVSTKGGGFGGAPQNVEDILGSLYPQTSPEDEKRLRRKDFLAAAGQGLSALSQGNPVDFTNIRQAAEARRQQGVTDMRERERARAAASLVYSQTGDADMAGAIASGAIQYGDVINERERQRIERDADLAKVKQAQVSGTLAKVYADVLPTLGLSDAAAKTITDGIASGMDPAVLLAPSQLAKVADEARKSEEAAADAAALRESAIASFLASGDPIKQRAAEYMSLSDMSVQEASKLAVDELGKPDEKAYQFEAEIKARMEALGEDRATATRSVLDKATQQGINLTLGPDGKITGVSVGGTAPAGGTAVPGSVIDIAKPEPGTIQGVTSEGDVTQQPIPGAVAPQQALVDLATSQQAAEIAAAEAAVAAEAAPVDLEAKRVELATQQQALTEAITTAPDAAVKLNAEARLAEVNAQIAQADFDALAANQSLDIETKETALEAARANIEKTKLDVAAKLREVEDAETGEKATAAKRIIRDSATTTRATQQVSRLLGMSKDWQPGIPGGISRLFAGYFPGSEIYDANTLVSSINANAMIRTIQLMKEASPTGSTGFGSTTVVETDAMQNELGKLDTKGGPDIFMEALKGFNNYVLDSAYGTQADIRANDALTDAEKEFYGQRFDLRTGEIVGLGLEALDEGVITIWDKDDQNSALETTPSDLSPEEREVFDMIEALSMEGDRR
jgi:hypothetical protein